MTTAQPTACQDWANLGGGADHLIVERIAPDVLRLSESVVSATERSFFYLIEGQTSDCLIDGGWGFCHQLPRRDPSKPLIAIATHSHFDHIGALHLANRIYGHGSEAATFADPVPEATQALPYLAGRAVLSKGGCIDPQTIRHFPCPLDYFVADDDTIDLGGRSLMILHTPGHSPGSLSVLEDRDGLLFCADTVHDGHIWDDIPGADRAALLLSHQRLARVDFMQACPGHGEILDRSRFLERIAQYDREAGPEIRES